jgi:hypothetical protein
MYEYQNSEINDNNNNIVKIKCKVMFREDITILTQMTNTS